MPDRLVRFAESFFEDLDRYLPAQRSPDGMPSATDFLLYDLPRLRDRLAADFEGDTLAVPDVPPVRVLIGAGTLVRSVAVYAYLDGNEHVVVIGLDVSLGDDADGAE